MISYAASAGKKRLVAEHNWMQRRIGEGPNPGGLCLCGCGGIAPIARCSRGDQIIGKPLRYMAEHHSRKRQPGTPADVSVRYDPEDHALVMSRCWHVKDGYLYGHSGGRTVTLHRLIMKPPPELQVDHINGDRLDNRRVNLRIVTKAENQQNRVARHALNRSGYRGVTRTKYGRWVVKAKVHGQPHYIGTFTTVEEAGKAARAWRLMNMPGATG
jgi:hypothetical protein